MSQDNYYPTGMEELDTMVDDFEGIPKGSTVAVIGPPESSAEKLLHSIAGIGKTTKYVSVQKPRKGIKDEIKRNKAKHLGVTDEDIEENVEIEKSKKKLDENKVKAYLEQVKDGVFVIDSMTASTENFSSILTSTVSKTRRHNGVSFLYFVASDTSKLSKQEREGLQVVDGVIEFDIEKGNGELDNYMYIHKLRNARLPKSGFSLSIKKNIDITQSGNI